MLIAQRTARSAVPTIESKDVWPIGRGCNQIGAYWVHSNVIRFFFEAFVASQAMVEEIALPADAVMCCLESLPRANDSCHLLVLGKAEQGVEMIWHKQEKMDKPASLLVKKQR